MDEADRPPLRVAVVGVSAAGKSTLVAALRAHGFNARHVAQEHSGVADMWRRISRPDVLIFLDASYETTCARRSMLGWGLPQYERERARLAHARAHCDLYIATDDLSAGEVLSQALGFLHSV